MRSSPTSTRTLGASELASIARSVSKYVNRFDMETNLSVVKGMNVVRIDEIRIGRILGEGGFNDVHEVRIDRPEMDSSNEYVIKHLNRKVKKSFKSFRCGAVDLALEAKVLASLNHKNIISLHGVSQGFSPLSAPENGVYFLILGKLDGTVEDKLEVWRKQRNTARRLSRFGIMVRRQAASVEKAAVLNRLKLIAQPVAEAMKYLHIKRVIYRDLKPQNVGFARDGTIKLFDFGLAREVVDEDRLMTASTGSCRYMAPEVALGHFYDFSADVYSFAIFLWEILTLEKPFESMSRSSHEEKVIKGGNRPKLGRGCGPAKIQKLIQNSWSAKCEQRPDFFEIVSILQAEIQGEPELTRTASLLKSFSDASISFSDSNSDISTASDGENEPPRKRLSLIASSARAA